MQTSRPALDSRTGVKGNQALLSINEQLGTTMVIITHNASIQTVADRVLFFPDGRINPVKRNARRRAAADGTW